MNSGNHMMNVVGQFIYLQALDVLTTLVFMTGGVAEGNPLIRLLAGVAGSPLGGLLVAKSVAFALATYCWRRKRQRLISRINVVYAALVAWNLVAFLVSAVNLGPT